jgi:hypothetical protein
VSVKDKFSSDEWENLLRAPMLVAYAVAGAAPSKTDDFIREMAAVADGVVEGERRAAQDSLLGAVAADIIAGAEAGRRGPTERLSNAEVRGRALEACRAVADALETKISPAEAYEYKRWLLVVAEKVAAAAEEGGFLGLGGRQISGSEVSVINEIGEAIRI